jgi:hypothetical protein
VPVLRKDWNGVEGTEGDVFYFGIVDVLQPYTLKKQLEHSLKSLVQVLYFYFYFYFLLIFLFEMQLEHSLQSLSPPHASAVRACNMR